MESIIGALNALILNRLVTRVNTGQGKNIPVSIIVTSFRPCTSTR